MTSRANFKSMQCGWHDRPAQYGKRERPVQNARADRAVQYGERERPVPRNRCEPGDAGRLRSPYCIHRSLSPYGTLLAAALCAALAICILAQDEPAKLDPVKWSLKADIGSRPLKAGDKFDVQLTAEIEEGWHLYSTEEMPQGPKPTRINLAADQPFEMTGSIDSPLPQTAFDENFGIRTEFYEQSVTFSLPLQVNANAPAGKRKLTVQVRYQSCTEKLCLAPKLVKLEAEVEIKSGK